MLFTNISEFKLKFSPPYFKILAKSLIHRDLKYKEGLNEDIIPFNPSGECCSGGLYFTNKHYIHNYCGYGDLLAEIELCEDSKVWLESEKAKANKFNIIKIRDLLNPLSYDISLNKILSTFTNIIQFKRNFNILKENFVRISDKFNNNLFNNYIKDLSLLEIIKLENINIIKLVKQRISIDKEIDKISLEYLCKYQRKEYPEIIKIIFRNYCSSKNICSLLLYIASTAEKSYKSIIRILLENGAKINFDLDLVKDKKIKEILIKKEPTRIMKIETSLVKNITDIGKIIENKHNYIHNYETIDKCWALALKDYYQEPYPNIIEYICKCGPPEYIKYLRLHDVFRVCLDTKKYEILEIVLSYGASNLILAKLLSLKNNIYIYDYYTLRLYNLIIDIKCFLNFIDIYKLLIKYKNNFLDKKYIIFIEFLNQIQLKINKHLCNKELLKRFPIKLINDKLAFIVSKNKIKS